MGAAAATQPSSGSGVGVAAGLCLLRLKERPTAAKLDVLFKMNYYQHAILLAKSASYGPEDINRMYVMYGDHKYNKLDFAGAMAIASTIHSDGSV